MKRYIDINIDIDVLTKEEAIEIIKTKQLYRMKQEVVSLINKIMKELKILKLKLYYNGKEVLPINFLNKTTLYCLHEMFSEKIDDLLNRTHPIDWWLDDIGHMINITEFIEDISRILVVLEKAEKSIDSIKTKLEEQ